PIGNSTDVSNLPQRMTADKLAKVTGLNVSAIQQARRLGVIAPESGTGGRGLALIFGRGALVRLSVYRTMIRIFGDRSPLTVRVTRSAGEALDAVAKRPVVWPPDLTPILARAVHDGVWSDGSLEASVVEAFKCREVA